MFYLKRFDTHEEYSEYLASNDEVRPYVNICGKYDDVNPAHLHYYSDDKKGAIIVKYKKVKTEFDVNKTPFLFIANYPSLPTESPFEKIVINGKETTYEDIISGNCDFVTMVEEPQDDYNVFLADNCDQAEVYFYLSEGVTTLDPYDGKFLFITSMLYDYFSEITYIHFPPSLTDTASCFYCPGCDDVVLDFKYYTPTVIDVDSLDSWYNLGYSVNNEPFQNDIASRTVYYDEETGDQENEFNLSIKDKIGELHIDVPLGLTKNQLNSCFQNIDNLVSVNIPSGYTTLSGFTFSCNKNLTSVTLNQITSAIPANFLDFTPNLKHFTIPNGYTSILGYAFYFCGLEELHIPASITGITNSRQGYNAALGCMPSLTSITVDVNNTVFDSRDNCNAILKGNILYRGCINTVIPTGITTFSAHCFSATEFETFTVPDAITSSLGNYSFAYCTKLRSINTGKNVISLNNGTFSGCSALEEVHIGDATSAISATTFDSCPKLQDIYFGSGITNIPNGSFETCHPDIRLHFTSATPPNLPQTWAANMPDITIVVPSEYYSTYAASTSFNRYVAQMIPEEGGEWITVNVTASTDSSSLSAALSSYSIEEITKVKVIGTINSYDVKLWRETLTSLFYLDLSEATIVASDYAYNQTYKTKDNTITGYFVGPYIYDLKLPNNATSMENSACAGSNGRLGYCNIPSGITAIPHSCFTQRKTLKEVSFDGNITIISGSAFYDCSGMKSITIPNTCTKIDTYAFIGCTALKTVNLPSSLNELCEYCFSGCTSLSSVTLPNSLQTIRNNAFRSCSGLTGEIVIPSGVTTFEGSAFTGCKSIKSVVIRNGVSKIPSCTFSGCTDMTAFTIPNSVTKIENHAFYGCNKLSCNINLPTGLTEIGESAFGNCTKLHGNINFGPNIVVLGKSAFINCYELTGTLTIPTGITKIQSTTFMSCRSLTSLVLHNGLVELEERAFYGCSGFTGTLSIPSALTSIGNNAFGFCGNFDHIVVETANTVYDSRNNCDALIETETDSIILACKNTTIPNSINEIGDYAFSYQTSLTSMVIPDSIEKIGSYIFYQCTNLSSVTIGTGITEIPNYSFYYCTSLTSITIPSNVKMIGTYAFYYCRSLSSVTFNEGLETIDNNAFYITKLSSIELPNTIKYVGKNVFSSTPWYDNQPSNELIYLGNVAYIYKGTLQSNSAITLSAGTTCIAGSCFANQSKLTGITIPDSVISIGPEAFYYDSNMTGTLHISSSMERIGNSAFFRCSGLTMVDYGSVECLCRIQYEGQYANPRNEKNTLYPIYVQGVEQTSITVPNTVEEIGNYALWYATGITSVTLHSGVKRIGQNAFRGCSGLTAVNITNGVESIGEYAFSECSGLTTANIANSVEYIGNYAFCYCKNLTSINIPDSVNILGQYAFQYCSAATQAYIGSGITEYGVNSQTGGDVFGNPFYGCSGLTSLTINTDVVTTREGSAASSLLANLFNKNIKSLTIGNAVTSLANYFAISCSAITSLTIGSSVQTIGDNAFNGCNSYTALTLPNSLQTIGGSAFSFNKIVTISIPNSVTSLGENAFYSGASATSITVGDGLPSIGDRAFRYSTKVTTATIGSAVTSLGSYAFGNCTSLMSLTVKPTSPPTYGSSALYNVPSTCNIYVPSASVTAYKNATGWKDRKNYIQAIP